MMVRGDAYDLVLDSAEAGVESNEGEEHKEDNEEDNGEDNEEGTTEMMMKRTKMEGGQEL